MTTIKYIAFIGCYTKPGQADPFEGSHGGIPHDRSKVGTGVLALSVNVNGCLSFLNNGEPLIKAEDWPNPSYLAILERSGSDDTCRPESLRKGGLCVVSEGDEGKWQTFSLHQNEGISPSFVAKAIGEAKDTGGSYPCHIFNAAIRHRSKRCEEFVFISNYGEEEGVLSVFCTGTGTGTDPVPYMEHSRIPFGPGSGANISRQQSSHAHSACAVETIPTNSSSMLDVCVADLGSDSIVQFSVIKSPSTDTSNKKTSMQFIQKGKLATPAGSGPRSLMFNPNSELGNIAVVSLELTAQVCLIRRRIHDGILETIGTPLSILPQNWPTNHSNSVASTEIQFNRGLWASDAIWSPDGKFVYAAARLHDSISVFKLKYSIDRYRHPAAVVVYGLELVDRIPTLGRTPRCLAMSDCGTFLLVAHQHSHDISSFLRDKVNGTLSFVSKIEVNCAACVKLVSPEKIG